MSPSSAWCSAWPWGSCPGLTGLERELMPLGAKTMTLECGVRFLTDYLEGDTYFHTNRSDQNLDRARTQMALVRENEENEGRIRTMIRRILTEG